MIEKNEYRIGNYVDGDGRDVIITGHYLSNMEKGMKSLPPIKITEEWLLRFGCDKKLSRFILNEKYFLAKYNDEKGCMFGIYITDYPSYDIEILCFIQYIHQLQNLVFAITQKELTLK